jgi:hypothetical protein
LLKDDGGRRRANDLERLRHRRLGRDGVGEARYHGLQAVSPPRLDERERVGLVAPAQRVPDGREVNVRVARFDDAVVGEQGDGDLRSPYGPLERIVGLVDGAGAGEVDERERLVGHEERTHGDLLLEVVEAGAVAAGEEAGCEERKGQEAAHQKRTSNETLGRMGSCRMASRSTGFSPKS